jgi:cyclohexadienyl dehydratase
MRWAAAALFVLLIGLAADAASAEGARSEPTRALGSGEASEVGEARETLRVGTSGDYAPFSLAGPGDGEFQGFDVAVARAFAEERGAQLEFVRFQWRELVSALAEKRFDVAMSGITVRPDRSTVGRFSVPVARTGAVVLARQPERWKTLEDVDRPGVRVGVNAGGHLEQVALARFERATVVSIPDNDAVRRALLELDLHAVVTDTLEAPLWRGDSESLEVFGPLTRDRKAYLVRNDLPELAESLDAWLLAREADGTLARLRQEHLSEEPMARTATPLGALLAAVDERLALMPIVGVAKRRAALPIAVPEREEVVLDRAVESARAAALRQKTKPPADAAVRRLFRAQMEAAKEIQMGAVRDPAFEPPAALPSLDSELRPALLRIGERITRLLIALPPNLNANTVRRAARDALRAPYLSEASTLAIADAITRTTRDRD